MKILGIDPGLTGALAVYDTDLPNYVEVYDVPTHEVKVGKGNRNVLATAELRDLLEKIGPFTSVYLERVSSRPNDGAVAAFKFGSVTGALKQACVQNFWRVEDPTPQQWKKVFTLIGKAKDDSRAKAQSKFPTCAEWFKRKKDHGRAEAALIALYGAMQEAHS